MREKLGLTLVAIIVWSTACKPPPKPEEVAISKAEKTISDSLRDPSSAQFKGVRRIEFGKDGDAFRFEVVCGLVNARNGFGGYSGFAPFYDILKYSSKIDGKDDRSLQNTFKVFSEEEDIYSREMKYFKILCLGQVAAP